MTIISLKKKNEANWINYNLNHLAFTQLFKASFIDPHSLNIPIYSQL